MPLTSFINRKAVLAFLALLIGFILVTFVLPFFALIRNRSSYEISIQLTVAFAIFFIASIFGHSLMRLVGPKRITCLSLMLATGACFILGIENDLEVEEMSKLDQSSGMKRVVDTIMMFADNVIFGYLLIVIATAFLAVASLEEIMSGTEKKLLRSKFVNASKTHLFVESTFLVYGLMQFAHIVGPIIGGLINTDYTMARTCTIMGLFGITACIMYLIASLWVYCTIQEEESLPNMRLSLHDLDDAEIEPIDVQLVRSQRAAHLRLSVRGSNTN